MEGQDSHNKLKNLIAWYLGLASTVCRPALVSCAAEEKFERHDPNLDRSISSLGPGARSDLANLFRIQLTVRSRSPREHMTIN